MSQTNGVSSTSASGSTASADATTPTNGSKTPANPAKPSKASPKASGSSSASPRTKLASDKVKQFATDWKEYFTEYCSFEETADELRKAKQELAIKDNALKGKDERITELEKDKDSAIEERDKKISELEKTNEDLFGGFEKRYSRWNIKEAELDAKITVLSENLQAMAREAQESSGRERVLVDTRESQKEEIDRLTALVGSMAAEVHSLKTDINLQSTAARFAEAQVASLEEQLAKWEVLVDTLSEPDFQQFSTNMAGLSDSCDAFVRKYFLGSLPEELLSDAKKWVQDTDALRVPLRLPPSNSPQAQRARMAAASNVLAAKICTNIFKAFYIPKDPAASGLMEQLLRRFRNINIERERVYRSILLFAWPAEDQEQAVEDILLTTQEEVHRLLKHFVIGDIAQFRKDLDTLLVEAVELWLPVQRSTVFVVASTVDTQDWNWVRDIEYDEETDPPEQSPGRDGQGPFHMNLFPCAYCDRGVIEVLHPGKALRSDQKMVVASKKEYKLWHRGRIAHANEEYLQGQPQRRSEGRFSKLMSPPNSPIGPSFSERSKASHMRARGPSVDMGRPASWTPVQSEL